MDYEEIPEDAAALIVNAPTQDFSADDTQKVLTYLEKGGDILINTTYTGQEMEQFSRILDFYGVQVSKGLIIETGRNSYYQDPFYLLPGVEYDAVTADIYSGNSYVFAPYCQGITVTDKEDVEVTPLLSSSEQSYVRDDIENSTSYDKQEGDVDGPFYIGVSCVAQTVGEEASTDNRVEEEENEELVTGYDGVSNGVIFSCADLFTYEADAMVAGTNQKLFSGALTCFQTEADSSVVIPVKSYEVEYLTISQGWLSVLALISTIVLPFGFLIMGFVIWFRRRKW